MSAESRGRYVSPVDRTQPIATGVVDDITAGQSDEVRVVVAELAETLAPRFELVGRLGAGGMGIVILARDPLLERNVAIKILSPHLASDPDQRARFVREAQAAAAVAHPNIVAIHLVGELPRSIVPYFVMQHVDGYTLDKAFPRNETVAETDASRILGDVAYALATAHERGIVHRDVKPSNIMIEAGSDRVVVLDFGISALTSVEPDSTRLTGGGMYVGTPRYMSPEQAEGSPAVTGKSDSYSLGCVAYELMTRKPPFEGNSALVLMAAHLKEPPPDIHAVRPDVSPRFARLVSRCLAKNPADRPSPDEIRRALAPPAALLAWPPRAALPMRDAVRRGMMWLNIAAVLVLVRYGLLVLMPLHWQLRSTLTTQEMQRLQSILILIAGAIALAELSLAAVRARTLFRLGYRLWPILDILGDHDGRTGELILGQRRFALLTTDEQRAVGSARVLRAAALNLMLPSAAVVAAAMDMIVGGLQAAPDTSWLVVAIAPVAGIVVWLRARQIEQRLTRETAAQAQQAALRDELRLQSRWLDRYWGAWRGVDRERRAGPGALAQRILFVAIVVATLITCLVLSLRGLLAAP